MADLIPSSRLNPCPVCGRTKDGDCRIGSDGLVLCHTHREGFRIGDAAPGGAPFRFVGSSEEGQGVGLWKPAEQWTDNRSAIPARSIPSRRPPAPRPSMSAPITGPITLARLPKPADVPPEHRHHGEVLPYSDTQKVVCKRQGDSKSFPVFHRQSDAWQLGAGPDPWPLWQQAEALEHGPGFWIAEAEGEKCADWLRAGGLVAISQPGHNHKVETITPRYLVLKQAGIQGVIYLADNDDQGRKKASNLQLAAADAELPLLIINAETVWPDLPAAGSIDDAPGTPADRVAAVIAAIPDAIARQQEQQAAAISTQQDDTRGARLTKAELQQFISSVYKVEFNELTRDCELDGRPMGSLLHLADSFLAQQHGLEVAKQAAADSFEFIAKSNPYNPVARYLLGLRGRSDLQRIDLFDLGKAFGLDPSDGVSFALLQKHLIGCAKRGLRPGEQHDQILVLSGQQGNGKSTGIEALAPPGMYDSATRVQELESKDMLAKINGAWLFEFDECDHILLKATSSEFKGFITRKSDNYVEKYEKQSTSHPRRCGLFGTTNHDEFLNDCTGNRRVWIIPTDDRPLDQGWIATNRDAIWFTVLGWIDDGITSWLAPGDDLALAAAARAEAANISDPWEGPIARVLEKQPLESAPGIAGITTDELLRQALGLDCDAAISRDMQMRTKRVVTGSGFRTHNGTVRWVHGRRRYGGGRPLAGFMPRRIPGAAQAAAAEPTSSHVLEQKAPVPTDSEGFGTAEIPCRNRQEPSLYQPVPTFSLNRSSSNKGEGGHAARDGACVPYPLPGAKVGTGWYSAENPSSAVDLSDPEGLDQPESVGSEGGPSGTGGMVQPLDQGYPAALLALAPEPWQQETLTRLRAGEPLPSSLCVADPANPEAVPSIVELPQLQQFLARPDVAAELQALGIAPPAPSPSAAEPDAPPAPHPQPAPADVLEGHCLHLQRRPVGSKSTDLDAADLDDLLADLQPQVEALGLRGMPVEPDPHPGTTQDALEDWQVKTLELWKGRIDLIPYTVTVSVEGAPERAEVKSWMDSMRPQFVPD